MRISVIVPAFNEERLLGETLARVGAALPAFARRGWRHELIVCDNNSNDRTADVARAAGATVVFEPLNQIARARNRGAQAASGEWLVFVDADSHPDAALFEDAAAAMASGRVLAGGSTVRLDGHHPRAAAMARLWNGISRACRWLAGSFIFCRADVFWRVGGFNQNLFAGEEIDLSRRLKRLVRREGRRVVILHRHPLLTSARKIRLYTPGEHAAFLLKTIWSRGKTLSRREACHTWYDGRR